MPALNFQKRLVSDIFNLIIRQSIRLKRKNPIKKGDLLYLYTGQRTKNCVKIFKEPVVCKGIKDIKIAKENLQIGKVSYINYRDLDEFAIKDGFKNWKQLTDFFRSHYGLPFKGVIIEW